MENISTYLSVIQSELFDKQHLTLDDGIRHVASIAESKAIANPELGYLYWWPVEAITERILDNPNKHQKGIAKKVADFDKKRDVKSLADLFEYNQPITDNGFPITFVDQDYIFLNDSKDHLNEFAQTFDLAGLRVNLHWLYKLSLEPTPIMNGVVGSDTLNLSKKSEAMHICKLLNYMSGDPNGSLSDKTSAYFLERLVNISPNNFEKKQVLNALCHIKQNGQDKLKEPSGTIERMLAQFSSRTSNLQTKI